MWVDVIEYVNKSCPKCGENLLTEKDYLDGIRFLKIVKWINKWFSWITIFKPNTKYHKADVHIHNGLNMKIKK